MSTTRISRGVPPLKNLQAILDAKGMTRAQLTRRTGLSAPTIRRAIEAQQGVRASTTRKVAHALGVPQQALYAELTQEELARRAGYPPITVGRAYDYPETPPRNGKDGGEFDDSGEQESLRELLVRVEARLETIEETVMELASRPIAEFDVSLMERDGREGKT